MGSGLPWELFQIILPKGSPWVPQGDTLGYHPRHPGVPQEYSMEYPRVQVHRERVSRGGPGAPCC
jgi:hypothetical protein